MTPVDESFFHTAPQQFAHTWEIDQPADVVWSQLTGDQPLFWIHGMKIDWTSPPPFGVGTTRTVHILGLVQVKEHYFLWEEGHRKAFYGTAVNLPVISKLAEDYIVEPRGDGACAFTWKIAIEPSALGKPGAPFNRVLFGAGFRDTARHFHAT